MNIWLSRRPFFKTSSFEFKDFSCRCFSEVIFPGKNIEYKVPCLEPVEGWSCYLLWKQLKWKSRCHRSVGLCMSNRKTCQILCNPPAIRSADLTVLEESNCFRIEVKLNIRGCFVSLGKTVLLLCSRVLLCVPHRIIIQEGRITSSLLWKPSPWEGASS